MFFQDFLVVSGGCYAHFHAILVLFLGAFSDFCWCILEFFCIFLGYVFLGHTSDNVAARAKKNVLSGLFGRFTGLLCSFSCHFGSFGGIFGLFSGFRDFLVFFLGSVFLGHTSYKVAARAKKNVLSAFLVVSGGHSQAMLALGVVYFGRFLRYFTKKKEKYSYVSIPYGVWKPWGVRRAYGMGARTR